MTDQELKDLVASLAIQSKKTDEQLAKTDVQLAQTDAQLAKTDAKLEKTFERVDKLAKMYGGVANNQGQVAEEFYFNSLKESPVLSGITFDFIEKNITRSYHGITDEYDIVLVNGKDVFVIEVKYKVHPNDLKILLDKKMPNFKKLYPEYKNYTHHFGLASFYIDDDLKNQTLSNGVNILQRKGDVIEQIAA